MVGLQEAGKYLVGYNIALTQRVFLSDLWALGLDANGLNAFSLIFTLSMTCFLSVVIMLCAKRCWKGG